ncbi:MAG TPA: sulfite exporter TauE/SafE family protein [Anaerovoracaceae bacterium]|nr:sulfite exporter TauE/SafE family protein [Anaerovoracaceae bacterium]
MTRNILRKALQIEGMSCAGCELRLENGLMKIRGVTEVKASSADSRLDVIFDADETGLPEIITAVEKAGYRAFENNPVPETITKRRNRNTVRTINQLIGAAVVLLALHLIITNTVGYNFIPDIDGTMGYGVLFAVGLLTSVHCVAMCGGINISQCMSCKHFEGSKNGQLKPSFLYNAGRIVSYTAIGGIAGALGQALSFTGAARSLIFFISGAFMLIIGLNMLNIFPWLKKANPRIPKKIGNRIYNNKGEFGPFYVGLLNGLMPCGPLQAMQLYALGTGGFLKGAAAMFVFGMGTAPLLFGIGALSSVMSRKFTGTLMKFSAVLVMVLGIVMLGRGLSLWGVALPGLDHTQPNIAQIEGNVQIVSIDVKPREYTPIMVQKGIPVRFILNAEASSLSNCNSTVVIPAYDIVKTLKPGENVIEFTPNMAGNFPYSCKMAMIKSKIWVVDDIAENK